MNRIILFVITLLIVVVVVGFSRQVMRESMKTHQLPWPNAHFMPMPRDLEEQMMHKVLPTATVVGSS